MKKEHNILLKKIGLFGLALLLVIIVWGGVTPDIASSQQLQTRLNRLESEFYGIESRLNRIESQLNQLGRSGGSQRAPSAPTPSRANSGQNRPQLSRDQMFDRLATLVIELKQQVNKLEARVSKLEPRGASRTNR